MNKFVSEVFSINLITTIIAYILLIFTIIFIPKINESKCIVLILSLEIFFTTIGINWIYNIYEDFLFITTRTLLFQIISLIATFVFVRDEQHLINYAIIVAFSSCGANLINYIMAKKKYCAFKFTFKCNLKKHLKPILIIFSTTVAITIYVNSDITILGFLLDSFDVGLYSTSVKIYNIIKNILVAMLMVLIPKFSIILNKKDINEVNTLFSKVFNVLITILLPISTGIFMISKEILWILSGEKYIAASNSLQLLCIATFFSLFAYMYTQCILIPAKKEWVVFKATILSATVNIILNLILIPHFGINAAAFTTIIAEMIVCGVAIKESTNYVKLVKVKNSIISSILGCFVIIIICFNVSLLFTDIIIKTCISVITSIFGYSIVLFIMKNPILFEGLRLINSIKSKMLHNE